MGLYNFLDNKRTLWIFLGLLAVLIVISFLTANVYRHVGLQGRVYVWNNAPPGAQSQAYTFNTASKEALAWTPPASMNVTPLGGVYVTYDAVFRNDTKDSVLTITAANGNYSKQTPQWKVTGGIHLYIEASKDGYQSVNTTATNEVSFFYKGGPSVAYFILVPEK